MLNKVYIIVFRKRDTGDEWKQFTPWSSRSGRPYVKRSVAQGVASSKARELPGYEFAVRTGLVEWVED